MNRIEVIALLNKHIPDSVNVLKNKGEWNESLIHAVMEANEKGYDLANNKNSTWRGAWNAIVKQIRHSDSSPMATIESVLYEIKRLQDAEISLRVQLAVVLQKQNPIEIKPELKLTDITKPVMTRNGQKVRILCTDAPTVYLSEFAQPIVGIAGDLQPMAWGVDGKFVPDSPNPDPMDLVNVPPKTHTGALWMNVYDMKDIDGNHITEACSQKINADVFAQNCEPYKKRVARVMVPYSWTEGQFDQ